MSSQGEDTNRQSNTHPFRAAGIRSAQANFTLSSKLYLADSRPSWKVFFLWQKIRQPPKYHQNGRNYPDFWPQPCCIQIRISIIQPFSRPTPFEIQRFWAALGGGTSFCKFRRNSLAERSAVLLELIKHLHGSGYLFNCQHSCEPPSIPTWGIWFSFQISNSCQLVEALSSTTLIRDI